MNEDLGQFFKLVEPEGIQDLKTEVSVLDLLKTVKKKLLGTPNVKRCADGQAFYSCAVDVKRAQHVLKEGLSVQHMNRVVAESCDDAGNPATDKFREFHDAIAVHLDLLVSYSMDLDWLIELLQDSIHDKILALEDKVGETKATTTMLEGILGSWCKTVEGCHHTLWGSVAELSITLQHHHELINGILKSLLKLRPEGIWAKSVSFSSDSGVTVPLSSDGGLSAEPFFERALGIELLSRMVFFISIWLWIPESQMEVEEVVKSVASRFLYGKRDN